MTRKHSDHVGGVRTYKDIDIIQIPLWRKKNLINPCKEYVSPSSFLGVTTIYIYIVVVILTMIILLTSFDSSYDVFDPLVFESLDLFVIPLS